MHLEHGFPQPELSGMMYRLLEKRHAIDLLKAIRSRAHDVSRIAVVAKTQATARCHVALVGEVGRVHAEQRMPVPEAQPGIEQGVVRDKERVR
jgi:hypothetical protein